MKPSYWHTQGSDTPLFPDIEWSKPEQRALAGKLLIVGGNKLGFAPVASAYETAQKAGIGACKAVVPDSLKSTIEPSVFDCVFAAGNASGGFSKDALPELKGYISWADSLLFIGESGRNAETAIVYEQLLDFDRTTVITRDALDLVRSSAQQWLQNPQLTAVATFAQLQKIFQEVQYPKLLLFRMQLAQLVDALHKFTLTYPATMVTMHQEQLIVAHDGEVSTTPCNDALIIWRGTIATRAAVYLTHHPKKPFQALTSAMILPNDRGGSRLGLSHI